jgi:MFS family permease
MGAVIGIVCKEERMKDAIGVAIRPVHELITVWKRQRRNWRIVAARQIVNRFFMEFNRAYLNVYITELGASPVDLGIVNSFTGISNALISVPLGWLQDRYSLRKLFLIGIGLLAIVPLIYALATNWMAMIPAMVIAALASREGSCLVICNICLENGDRITAKSICEGIGRIPSLFAPIAAAYVITLFGGISAEGIRPLFWVQFVVRCILFLFVATQMTEIARPQLDWSDVEKKRFGFSGAFRELFKQGTFLKRWIFFVTISSFSRMMMMSFRYPFAHEIKGAEEFTIGALATAAVLLQIVAYTPTGKVADKIGRKKTLYMLMPVVWMSNLMFVLAPTPEILVVASFLNGFEMVVMVVRNAMTAELVPREYMGRWTGVLGLFVGLVSIPAPVVGGIVWERIGPEYVFLIPIALDLIVGLPLLVTMPETLHARNRSCVNASGTTS